jgi:hypothetical protein
MGMGINVHVTTLLLLHFVFPLVLPVSILCFMLQSSTSTLILDTPPHVSYAPHDV